MRRERGFRIGSVTKTFTGTVILQAAQRGALALDDPVSRFRPGVPNGQQITIAQLLSMRSGLYDYAQARALNRTMDRQPRHVFRPRDLLGIAYAARPHPHPGGGFEYCNTNTILLGLIAEQLYGRPLGELYQHHLFRPLGMSRSSMPGLRAVGIPFPHPRGYMFGTNVSTLDTERLPPRQLAAADAGRLRPRDVTIFNPSWAGAAGAGISTAEDLAKFAKGICDGSLLNRRWQRTRLDSIRSVEPSNPHSSGYGLAIAKRGAVYGHGARAARIPELHRLRPGAETHAGRLDEPQGITPGSSLRPDDRRAAPRAAVRLRQGRRSRVGNNSSSGD